MIEKEYIERETAISGLDELEKTSHHNSVLWPEHVEECREALRSIPAADVRPIVRGKWITRTDVAPYRPDGEITSWTYKCGICNTLSKLKSNFCPDCGADMREINNGI